MQKLYFEAIRGRELAGTIEATVHVPLNKMASMDNLEAFLELFECAAGVQVWPEKEQALILVHLVNRETPSLLPSTWSSPASRG